MTRLRVVGCGVIGAVVAHVGEYAGAPAFSYQGFALLTTLAILVSAYTVGAGQQADSQQSDEDGRP